MTILDAVLVGFTLLSALLAMVRGFSREVLSIASWAGAAVAAYYFYKPVTPLIAPYIPQDLLGGSEQVAMVIAAAIVFLIALVVITIITMKIADFIIDSRIGALDRTLGFLYGAARGILVVAVGLLFYTWLAGSQKPDWIANAKSLWLLEDIGARIESIMPENPEQLIPSLPGEASPPDAGTAPPAEAPANN